MLELNTAHCVTNSVQNKNMTQKLGTQNLGQARKRKRLEQHFLA